MERISLVAKPFRITEGRTVAIYGCDDYTGKFCGRIRWFLAKRLLWLAAKINGSNQLTYDAGRGSAPTFTLDVPA